MAKSKQIKPAQVFHPGEYLRDEIVERGWTVSQLAKKLYHSEGETEAILAGRRDLTPIDCSRIGLTLGTGMEVWQGLQAAWDRWPDRRSTPDHNAHEQDGEK